ncbi:MAG: GDP-mannose 4,6-dehydratase [Candidatus Ratteibacteria bacterium]|nr:GDP-mannose 4,6-dehydratase [Candidatus Ratteibacteria bacterium]
MKKSFLSLNSERSIPKNSFKRIFITGGCGFIGANLVKYFLDRDETNITVYDNLSTGSKDNLNKAVSDSRKKGRVKLIKGDILDISKLSKSLKGSSIVVHLAAHTKVIESLAHPEESHKINTIGTFNVIESARTNKIDKFIFASSNATVGEQTVPINEKIVPQPISPYGASKLYGEALCSSYFRSYGLKTIALRFANVYGGYSQHKTSVIPKFIKTAKEGKNLEIYGDGKQTRDFINVKDICQAIYLCSTALYPLSLIPNIYGEIFQIATGKETKIIDLAKTIQDLTENINGQKLKIVFKKANKGEIRKNYSDITKAKKLLNFKPTIDIKEGLRDLILTEGVKT